MANCTFDGVNSLILMNNGVSSIDIKIMYSEWKQWVLTSDNAKYLEAFRNVGGDPLPGSKALGATYFLLNGWKIRPFEGNHTLTVNGNLYCEDGSSPYVPTVGNWSVFIISAVSNLVDSTIQQLPEIEQGMYQNQVTIDAVNGKSGTVYPIGTPENPVNNFTDAKAIAVSRGLLKFFMKGNYTFSASDSISGYEFIGLGAENSKITLTQGIKTSRTTFREMSIDGWQDGETHYYGCEIKALSGVHCKFEDCLLVGPMTLEEGSFVDTTVLVNCYTGYDKTFVDPALKDEFVVNLNNSSLNMAFNNFYGKMKFINLNHATTAGVITVNMGAGKVTVDSSCTKGTIKVRGDGEVIDFSQGTTVDNDITANLVTNAISAMGLGGGLTSAEHTQLMSLNNVDIVALIDGIWNKTLPNGVTVQDYITYKLLTTNKFIGLS